MTLNFRKCIAAMLTISMLAMSLPAPSWARIVPTDSRSQDHDRVEQMLVESGVDPAQAKSRVAALTSEEAARIAAEFDAMPAGSGGGGGDLALAVVIALLLSVDPGAVVVLGVGLLLAVFASSRSGKVPNSDHSVRAPSYDRSLAATEQCKSRWIHTDEKSGLPFPGWASLMCNSIVRVGGEPNARLARLKIDHYGDIELLGSEADRHEVLAFWDCPKKTVTYMVWQSFELRDRQETLTGEGKFAPDTIYALDGMDSSDPLVELNTLVCGT